MEITEQAVQAKTAELERRLADLQIKFARHNPSGFGFDSAFGHKGGGSADEGDGTFVSSITHQIWYNFKQNTQTVNTSTALAAMTFPNAAASGDHRFFFVGNQQSGAGQINDINIHEFAECIFDLYESDNHDDCTTRDRAGLPAPHASFDCALAPNGTIFMVFSEEQGASTDTFTMQSFDEASLTNGIAFNDVAVTGTDQPPDLEDGDYKVTVVSDTVLWVMHAGSLYKGDISSPTAVAFNTTPVVLTIATYTGIDTDGRWNNMASDGTDIFVGIGRDISSSVWHFEKLSGAAAASLAVYNDILIWGPGQDGLSSPTKGDMRTIVYFRGEWCMVGHVGAQTFGNGPMIIVSLPVSDWTDDS